MITALIVAAGRGVRMGGTLRKQYLTLGGRPVLSTTLKAFDACPHITTLVVVTPEDEIAFCRETIIAQAGLTKEAILVPGGERRQDSVYNGLQRVQKERGAMVLIHDGVRPFVTNDLIEACICGARRWGACIPALDITDTLKQVTPSNTVARTVSREFLRAVQTPQAFELDLIKAAHERARAFGWEGTDDAGLIERMGGKVHLVPGDPANFKITTPEDLERAEFVLSYRRQRDGG